MNMSDQCDPCKKDLQINNTFVRLTRNDYWDSFQEYDTVVPQAAVLDDKFFS